MVVGRFNGDRVAAKFGPLRILFTGGIFAGVGLAFGLLVGGIYPQIFAWFAIGTGMSVVIPMVFSLAGEIARERFDGRVGLLGAELLARVDGRSRPCSIIEVRVRPVLRLAEVQRFTSRQWIVRDA